MERQGGSRDGGSGGGVGTRDGDRGWHREEEKAGYKDPEREEDRTDLGGGGRKEPTKQSGVKERRA